MGLGKSGKINGIAVRNVGIALNNVMSEVGSIQSAANNIDASLVSSFSSSATGGVETINSNVSTLMEDLSNLETSYDLTSEELYAAIDEERRLVEEELKGLNEIQGTVTVTGENKAALDAKIAFYFNYPSAAKEAKQIPESKLRSLFEQNGAKKVDANTYQVTVDGKTYNYNVKNYRLESPGNRGSIYARFFASDSADYSHIKSTITIMGGSGAVDRNSVDSNLNNGVRVGNNSIVILPYAEGIGNNSDLVAGSTRVADSLGGGTPKTITNSIIGYSLGGHIATKAICRNPGVYKAVVYVNSGMYTSDLSINQVKRANGSYAPFKNMQIIFFEGANDKFVNSSAKTINTLVEQGTPKANFYIYTTDHKLLNKYQGYLGSDHVMSPPNGYAVGGKNGWNGHSYGFNMIKNSNIVNYLSEL